MGLWVTHSWSWSCRWHSHSSQEAALWFWHWLFIYFIYFKLCIYFERERQCEWGRGRERGKERIPSRLLTVSTEPDEGFDLTKPWDHDLSQILNQLSHPGAPGIGLYAPISLTSTHWCLWPRPAWASHSFGTLTTLTIHCAQHENELNLKI